VAFTGALRVAVAGEPVAAVTDTKAEQPPGKAAADDKAIVPFVNEGTRLVVRIDLDRSSLDAIEDLLVRAVPATTSAKEHDRQIKTLRADVCQVRQLSDSWTKAGIRRIYRLYNSGDPAGGDTQSVLPWGNIPLEMVVPLDAGADAKTVVAQLEGLCPGSLYTSTVQSDNVVLYGSREVVATMRTRRPVARPELAAAMAAAPDAAARVVLIPGNSTQVADALNRVSSLVLGPSESSDIAAQLANARWALLAADTSKNISLTLSVQCKDAAAADRLVTSIRSQQLAFSKATEKSRPQLAKALAGLEPAAAEARVTLTFESKRLEALVAALMQPRARSAEEAIQWSANPSDDKHKASMSNMADLLMYCRMYAENHDGQWPKDLQAVVPYAGSADNLNLWLLVNPAQPKRHPAYVYLPPAKRVKAGEAIVLYEIADQTEERINVGFADGTVKVMTKGQLDAALGGHGQKTITSQSPLR